MANFESVSNEELNDVNGGFVVEAACLFGVGLIAGFAAGVGIPVTIGA